MCWQPGNTIDDLNKIAVEQALRFFGGNKTKTAHSLGIAIRTLDGWLLKYAAAAGGKDGEINGGGGPKPLKNADSKKVDKPTSSASARD